MNTRHSGLLLGAEKNPQYIKKRGGLKVFSYLFDQRLCCYSKPLYSWIYPSYLSPCMLECSKYALVIPAKSALSFMSSLADSSSSSSYTSLVLSGTIVNLINIEYRCSRKGWVYIHLGSTCWLEKWCLVKVIQFVKV